MKLYAYFLPFRKYLHYLTKASNSPINTPIPCFPNADIRKPSTYFGSFFQNNLFICAV